MVVPYYFVNRPLLIAQNMSAPSGIYDSIYKNAPWKAIQDRIAQVLQRSPAVVGVQAQTDQLMTSVLEAIHALTPKAKPSPYAKRWWTTDLNNLRRLYTYQRNQLGHTGESGQYHRFSSSK